MRINRISQAVQKKLEDLQINIEDTDYDAFVDVLNHPQDESTAFSGYPSATHFYRETSSNYSTVSENRRRITYDIFVYLQSPNKTLQQLYQEAYLLIDAVQDEFDKTEDLIFEGDVVADFVTPVPGSLGREDVSQGVILIANIRLELNGDVAIGQ
jgi:hypothetical protein